MKHASRWKPILAVALGVAIAVALGALSPGASAKTQKSIYPPTACSGCLEDYVGPNGGICRALGCWVQGGSCVMTGDCE